MPHVRSGRRFLLFVVASTVAGYGLYLHHRRRITAVLFLIDMLSEVGSDLADFLHSDSDHVPQSLLQLSKLSASDHVSSVASSQRASRDPPCPSLHDRILDRFFSPAGTRFSSAILGSFARKLVLFCHDPEAKTRFHGEPEWLATLCSNRVKEAAAELVRIFVSTTVVFYLYQTAAVCTSDQVLDGITNPNHEAKLKDLVIFVCNGAIELASSYSFSSPATSTASSSPYQDTWDIFVL